MATNQSSNEEDEAVRESYNFVPVPSVYDHDIRFENRNTEELHHGILEAARLEHERVRNEALRIFQITLIQEQQLRAQHEIRAEEERLRIEEMRLKIEENRVKAETQSALAEIKRRELEEAARRIPVVPPKPPTPPPVAEQTNGFSNNQQQQPPKQPSAQPTTRQQPTPTSKPSASKDHLLPGVRPEMADPVGVIAVSIFARDEFLWRGASLIDILMAKMRVSIPVVFGLRGNDKTEEGRARIGWQRLDDGSWIDEQAHNNRMVGLAAGYAAISLRDFSKVKLTNPWPPTYYWRAMASIVSTPTEEASSTQYTALRSMIEGWEQRFIELYGVQAIAALRVALVDFPARAPPSAKVAAGSLSVLVDKLDRDKGLTLAY
ncbi:GLE1-like protein [Botrytis cinerea]